EADATAARVQQAFGAPLLIGGRVVDVRASIGLATARDGQDADEVLADADVAMYSAKAMGRGRSARFTDAMRAEVVERHEIETDLRRALERDEFEVVYQPQVNLRTGEVIGAEALVRWRHPEKGVIPPARFIGIAEQSDLIVTIGRRVLGAAAHDVRRFSQVQGSSRFHVAVNFSPRELSTGALADVLSSVTQDAGIPTNMVMVELTESAFAADEGAIATELQRLRALGVRIALDDFGTGYSALAYLRKFPIDIIKVDKSFVSWVRRDAANDGVTRAIVSMARSLSLDTIAEGVETDDQVAWLQGMGCTMGQGYLFGRPVSASEFEEMLRGWNPARYASRAPAPLA
ncbi:MAG: EAL domain-containing protein, partial [Gemmatimonadetes bacterium]|nr:EAL domain-containing protein [Gemmatimonadota bacterium]